MKISEPMTMFTDYLIALECLYFLLVLFSQDHVSYSQILFALFLITVIFGAVFGGTAHGFKHTLGEKRQSLIWKLTLYQLVGSSFLLMMTIVTERLTGYSFFVFFILSLLNLIYFSLKVSKEPIFLNANLSFGLAALTILIIEFWSYFIRDEISALYIIFGIFAVILGSIVQISKIKLHDHFNYNDIFHLIELVALYLLYLGVQRF